jgi:hypothetical protein
MGESAGGVWWEWLSSTNWSRASTRIYCVPEDDTNYGAVVKQDLKAPVIIHTFKGHGLSGSELNSLIAQQTRGADFTVVDYVGVSRTGEVTSVTRDGQGGLPNLHDVTLQLQE